MVSSPLARVTEETPSPLKVHTDADILNKPSKLVESKLVSVDTPRNSGELPIANGTATKGKENEPIDATAGAESRKANGGSKVDSGIGELGDMKTVEI
jgi:hypothetical protein